MDLDGNGCGQCGVRRRIRAHGGRQCGGAGGGRAGGSAVPDELCSRIYKRGTDSEDVIKRRLASATGELAYANEYDYIVVNDVAQKATSKVLTIMEAERYRAARTYFIINEICHAAHKEREI